MLRSNWKIISLIAIALVSGTVALVEYRRANTFRDRLDCAGGWLERAKALSTVHKQKPGNFTGDAMRKLIGSVDEAYDCATKEPVHSRIAPGGGSFGQHGVLPH